MENEEKREEHSAQSGGGAGKAVGVIIVIVIIAIAAFAYEQHAKQKTETAMTPPIKKSTMQPTSAQMAQSMLKDGTYTAEGDYITHVGQKHIKVTITLKKDIITSADVVNEADDRMSQHFQDSFIGGYKPEVIGKDITQVHLSKVAESSLTPNGFNDALTKIEKQAQS